MKVAMASDHGGFRPKAGGVLSRARAEASTRSSTRRRRRRVRRLPDYAHRAAELVASGAAERAILVCGSGVGMSLAANRHRGVRAVVCSDVYTARMSREHNDANVLCLGERVVGPGLAWEIASTWLATAASTDERHTRRVRKIDAPSA